MTVVLWVDFCKSGGEHLPLTDRQAQRLAQTGLRLHDGMPVVLYQDDAGEDGTINLLVVDARFHWNEKEGIWVAEFLDKPTTITAVQFHEWLSDFQKRRK